MDGDAQPARRCDTSPQTVIEGLPAGHDILSIGMSGLCGWWRQNAICLTGSREGAINQKSWVWCMNGHEVGEVAGWLSCWILCFFEQQMLSGKNGRLNENIRVFPVAFSG